jgi:hypothetical protein
MKRKEMRDLKGQSIKVIQTEKNKRNNPRDGNLNRME